MSGASVERVRGERRPRPPCIANAMPLCDTIVLLCHRAISSVCVYLIYSFAS
eukprot:COSAG01_NODE_60273_length_295_cov_1.724490_1_plen_51_part_01